MSDTLDLKVNELQTYINQAGSEIKNLQGGRKAAAPRARQALQKVKSTSHELRANIMEYVKSLPTKSRTKSEKDQDEIPEKLPLERS